MSSQQAPNSPVPEMLVVLSNKSPEEARIFGGLRVADIQSIRTPIHQEVPISPDDWGITSTSEHGICKYCQLMLHPDAPPVIAHQPNLQVLIDSKCSICSWVEVSIAQGAPSLVQRFCRGDPALCDEKSTTCGVTIVLEKNPLYTRATASVGVRRDFAERGVPLNLTTRTRLRNLFSRVFWQPFEPNQGEKGPRRLTVIKAWLDECRESHVNCLPGTHTALLPTRVLDLTGSPDVPSTTDDIKIKLRDTSVGEAGQYIALSYCWGADPEYHFKTTQQNSDEYRNGIDFGNIPLTQREAIVCALFLGIRYLWIDSLCIIQDSPRDWETEAARMSTVYSNAMLTLAATFSQSPADGLLNPLQAARCVEVHGDLAIVRMETHNTIDASSEPLNTRAWTLQEAVLSPRMISFGSEQWLWKCASRFATEDGLVDRPPSERDGPNHLSIKTKQVSVDGAQGSLTQWYRLVMNYSRRKLTYQDDKLKAIAGLADIYAKQTGYKYLVGLWAEDIATGLMWQATSHGVTRITGTTPTWSWASVDGAIDMLYLSNLSPAMISLVKIEQKWQGVPTTSPLEVARLQVRGAKIILSLGKESATQDLRYRLIRDPKSEEIFGEAFLDNLDQIEETIAGVHCLHVCDVLSTDSHLEHLMLLLVSVEHKEHRVEIQSYQRIGIGVMLEKSKLPNGQEVTETCKELLDTDLILE
ncbi:heterokaryon incompatibility protein-domain-containing protein [Xylariaceae sp. FL0255]|nr:heterokaryon incompatibility protein-domain-containing protein [Xylariaceae sp. FL0255]